MGQSVPLTLADWSPSLVNLNFACGIFEVFMQGVQSLRLTTIRQGYLFQQNIILRLEMM